MRPAVANSVGRNAAYNLIGSILPLATVLLAASAVLVPRGLPTKARTMAFDILRGKRAV